jgi:hypothetical protein
MEFLVRNMRSELRRKVNREAGRKKNFTADNKCKHNPQGYPLDSSLNGIVASGSIAFIGPHALP